MGIIDRFIDKRVQTKLSPIVKEFEAKLEQQKSMSFSNLSQIGIRSAIFSSLYFDITNSDTLYSIIRKRVMKEAAVPLLVYKKKSDKKNQFTKYLAITKGAQNAYSFQIVWLTVKMSSVVPPLVKRTTIVPSYLQF